MNRKFKIGDKVTTRDPDRTGTIISRESFRMVGHTPVYHYSEPLPDTGIFSGYRGPIRFGIVFDDSPDHGRYERPIVGYWPIHRLTWVSSSQRFCPYCDEPATTIGKGDDTLEYCSDCNRILEGAA